MFEARADAIEEPRFSRRAGPRLIMDLTRFTQHGGYSGSLTVAGKTYDAKPSRVWGSRDRSWGVRGIGPQDPAGVPSPTPVMGQFYWLWSPTNFEDVCTHCDCNENADGSRWHQFGAVTQAEPGAPLDLATGVDFNINYAPGTRHAKTAEIILRSPRAGESRIELKTLYNFYMQGIGYFHPKWGHGMYVGPDVSTYESFKTADVNERDLMHQHIQAVCQAKMGSREGHGNSRDGDPRAARAQRLQGISRHASVASEVQFLSLSRMRPTNPSGFFTSTGAGSRPSFSAAKISSTSPSTGNRPVLDFENTSSSVHDHVELTRFAGRDFRLLAERGIQ